MTEFKVLKEIILTISNKTGEKIYVKQIKKENTNDNKFVYKK